MAAHVAVYAARNFQWQGSIGQVTLRILLNGIYMDQKKPIITWWAAHGAEERNAMSKVITILTLVTNGMGAGPGHTAICFDDTVYSFEAINDWGSRNSAWVVFDYDAYIEKNAHRPVILQTVGQKVDAASAELNIIRAMTDDCDYISSGVCTSLVARAINAGTIFYFNPPGIDTPRGLYHYGRKMGIVIAENVIWEDQASMPVLQWASIVNRLKFDFAPVAGKLALTRSR